MPDPIIDVDYSHAHSHRRGGMGAHDGDLPLAVCSPAGRRAESDRQRKGSLCQISSVHAQLRPVAAG